MRQIGLPAGPRELATLAHIDYEDAFLVDTGLAQDRTAQDRTAQDRTAQDRTAQDRTAEQWAREILEAAPVSTRHALTRGWSMLGLRLGPAQSDQHVLGWEIRHSDPDVVLLGARGHLGLSGELIFQRSPCSLLYATVVQLENPIARGLWAAIESRHQRVVQELLARA